MLNFRLGPILLPMALGNWVIDLCTKRRVTLSIFLLLTVSFSISVCSITSNINKYEAKAQPYQEPSSNKMEDIILGAWVPTKLQLESLQVDEQINAIHTLLSEGFDEYYLVMRDFNNSAERGKNRDIIEINGYHRSKNHHHSSTSRRRRYLMLIMTGKDGSWDFNSIKESHPSFLGFAVDDFNAFVDIRRIRLMNSMDFMDLSNLSSALSYKREDVQFYPIMYVETGEFETLKEKYE